MKRLIFGIMLLTTTAYANDVLVGFCEKGGVSATVGSLTVAPKVQASYPSCTVQVNITGAGIATIYSDNSNTPLANPFTADTNGRWEFYAVNGRYTVTLSGGGFAAPFVIGDYLLFDQVTASGYVNGGNAFGAAGILGTTDNNYLSIIANNAEVMRALTNGNLQVTNTLNLPSLSASGVVQTNGSKNAITSNTLPSGVVLVAPVLGTPASGVATNLTGLPLTTGVTGTLPVANGGTGSTSSTGTGAVVRATSPTLVTPIIGAASGTSLSVTGQITSTVSTGTAPLAVSSTTNVANLNASSLSGATFGSPGSIGNGTPGSGSFTTLTASAGVTLSPASANIAISPTGTGTVAISPVGALTVNPTAASTINNTSIGATTALSGRFTGVTITTGGVIPSTAGTPIWYADTGIPIAGTQGTNTTGIANQLWYTQIFIPHNTSITNVAILCGGTCTTDKIAIGLWSTAGTLLAWTATTVGGGTVLSGANTWQKIALTTPYAAVGPARYIIGVVTSGTTAGDIQTAPLLGGVCAVASSMGTLASFSPATTTTTNSCPFAYVD